MNVNKKLRKIAGELAEVAFKMKGFPTLNPPKPKQGMGDYVRVFIQKDEQQYIKHFTTAKSVIARLVEGPTTSGSGDWEEIRGYPGHFTDDEENEDLYYASGEAYIAEFIAPTDTDAKPKHNGFWGGMAAWSGKQWIAIGNYGYIGKEYRKWNPPKRVK